MLTTIRQQMVCIIAPKWSGGAEMLASASVRAALDALFCDVGIVHFASTALLPALPPDKEPSLMLELVVEEGLSPYDLLYRLVNHPSGTMWSLYSAYWPAKDVPPEVSARNGQLLERLMDWHHIADGGFVGARDRSVWQIKQEKKLLAHTRTEARNLKPKYGADRATLALALARWANQNPSLDWATKPAPRSWFRAKGAGAKIGYVLAIIGTVLAFVWLLGWLSRLSIRFDNWFFSAPHPTVQAVLNVVSEASQWFLALCGRGALALLVLLFLGWLFLFVLPAFFRGWRRWLDSLNRELQRPNETWSSWSTYVAGWLFGVPLVLAVVACALAYTFVPDCLAATIKPWIPHAPGWKIIALGAILIALVLGIGALAAKFNKMLSRLGDWFFQEHEDDVQRAQQVHPTIEQCEAELVGKTAHMISLADMRSPNWWSAWWTRAVLRLVTFLGRVFFTEGRLGDAPGIHFGHWHVIDSGRRYLFCSNYDGNFGGYLDDFINGASAGTTLFWRWTKLKTRDPAVDGHPAVSQPRAFPRSRFLIFRGVKCELRFKSYARDSMLPHLYRFDAYNTTVDDIILATGVRDALFAERNGKNDDLIMRAIES